MLPAQGWTTSSMLVVGKTRQTGGATLGLGQLENLTLLGLKIVPRAAAPAAPGVAAKDLEPPPPHNSWETRSPLASRPFPGFKMHHPTPPPLRVCFPWTHPWAKWGFKEGDSAKLSTAMAGGAATLPTDCLCPLQELCSVMGTQMKSPVSPSLPSPSHPITSGSYHGDKAANEAEVGEVVWVDGRGRVDLQAVVVLTSVLKKAVHGVEHFMGQEEEPLPGTRGRGNMVMRGPKSHGAQRGYAPMEGTAVCLCSTNQAPISLGSWGQHGALV